MGRARGWGSQQTGRPAMRSPGRPSVARREHRQRFWEAIARNAAAGMTVLVTTHYMDEAELCHRLAFLSRGHLIGLGTPKEITARFGQPSVEDVFIELQRRDEGKVTMV